MIGLLIAIIALVAGIALGIVLAAATKKKEGVVASPLDKVTKITNIVMIPVSLYLAYFSIALSMFTVPEHDGGALFVIDLIICSLIWIAPVCIGGGLGLSAALRKRGRSLASFVLQFIGIMSTFASVVIYVLGVDRVISSIN